MLRYHYVLKCLEMASFSLQMKSTWSSQVQIAMTVWNRLCICRRPLSFSHTRESFWDGLRRQRVLLLAEYRIDTHALIQLNSWITTGTLSHFAKQDKETDKFSVLNGEITLHALACLATIETDSMFFTIFLLTSSLSHQSSSWVD